MQNLTSFKSLLDSPSRIVITTHVKPDADALGSSLGLAAFLKKLGHDVQVVSPSDYPDFLTWMDGNDDVIIYTENTREQIAGLVDRAEIIFCLDFSTLNRISKLGEIIRESKATKVLIDHHLDPEDFAEYKFWSTAAAATAELVFELIVDIGKKDLIDKSIAECLYAGIMTDTGSFKHSNTTQNVHLIVSELIAIGADVSKVAKLIYDTNSLNRVKFLGFALSERLVVLPEFNTAYLSLSEDDLVRFNSKTGDTEGFVNYALSIEGIKLAVVIIERRDLIKMSFRSIGDFSVNDFARNHFEGGGHKNAAGGKSTSGLDATVENFIELLSSYKDQLESNTKVNV